MSNTRHSFNTYPNPTGIEPKGIHLLIEMDAISEKYEGSGIIKNSKEIMIEENAQTRGRIVACASYAWDNLPQPEAQPGQRVIIAKYCGILHDWEGRKYRIIKDCEITATLRDDEAASNADKGDEA